MTTSVGRLYRSGDPEWDVVRGTFNLMNDQRPELIAVPSDAHEVAGLVAYARENGLRVTAQATGHNAVPLGSLEGTLLVKTSRLTGVAIDGEARRVRVGAATTWEQVTPGLSPLGLAALHGSSPKVGVVGYSLGGGIGWLARKHGMQCNAVTAIDIVTADGRLVRADAQNEPELFWALRGGNGNFGIVTAVEFTVQPVRELYSGALFFPIERAAEVLHAWNALLSALPEDVTSWACLLHFPPDPAIPDAVRGRSFVVVMAAHLGTEAEGRDLLSSLRRLQPELDSFAVQPPMGLSELAMDPVEPLPYDSTTALLDELTSDAVERIAGIGGAGSPLAMVQLRHGGGALGRSLPGAGARATIDGQIVLFGLGVIPDPEQAPAVTAALGELDDAVAAHRVGVYPNFVERLADASTFFDAGTWGRLQRAKASYDPEGLFRGNHLIAAPI